MHLTLVHSKGKFIDFLQYQQYFLIPIDISSITSQCMCKFYSKSNYENTHIPYSFQLQVCVIVCVERLDFHVYVYKTVYCSQQ